jgi:hypothetical protein
VWISVLAGTVIPAIVAARHHVFYEKDIEKQIITRRVQRAADIQTRLR